MAAGPRDCSSHRHWRRTTSGPPRQFGPVGLRQGKHPDRASAIVRQLKPALPSISVSSGKRWMFCPPSGCPSMRSNFTSRCVGLRRRCRGSDWFSVQAAADSVLLRGARGGSAVALYAAARGDESIDSLVARGGLERRKRRTRRPDLDGHGRRSAASCLSEVWRAVQFAPQHLLTNASGSVRSRSASHCSGPPRALEVS